jgi:hypothetical protein
MGALAGTCLLLALRLELHLRCWVAVQMVESQSTAHRISGAPGPTAGWPTGTSARLSHARPSVGARSSHDPGAMAFSFRTRSVDGDASARSSIASERSGVPLSEARSSLALERADAGAAQQPTLAALGAAGAASERMGAKAGKAAASAAKAVRDLPDELRSCARAFSVLGASSLVPVQVLARVWRCDDATALLITEKLSAAGLVRYATLQTGAVWCVLDAAYAAPLRAVYAADARKIAASLLAVYEKRKAFPGWRRVADDGFIMLHVVTLLARAHRPHDIRCAHAACLCAIPPGLTLQALACVPYRYTGVLSLIA